MHGGTCYMRVCALPAHVPPASDLLALRHGHKLRRVLSCLCLPGCRPLLRAAAPAAGAFMQTIGWRAFWLMTAARRLNRPWPCGPALLLPFLVGPSI